MILLTGQAQRTAGNFYSLKIATRGIVGIELGVARHEQIKAPVVIVVAPTGAGRPAVKGNPGFFRDVGKCSVMVVVIQAILAEICDVEVGPAIIVIIADCDAESPTPVSYAGRVCCVSKRSIVVIVQEHGPRCRLLAFEGGECGSVQQIYVQPAVVIVIKKRNP